RSYLDAADAALQERTPRADAVGLLLAGDDPGAARVPRAADQRGEVRVAETLARTIVDDFEVLGAEPERSRVPFRLRAEMQPPAANVDPREESRSKDASRGDAVQSLWYVARDGGDP